MTYPIAPVAGRAYFSDGSYSTLLTVALSMYAVPFIPRGLFVPAKIGVRVTTAGAGAGADVRLAIYDSLNGRPGNLVSDFGAVTALTGTGEYSVTINQSPAKQILYPGKTYWLTSLWNTAATTQPTVAALDSAVVPQDIAASLGVVDLSVLPSSAATAGVAMSVTGQTWGAFPSVAPVMTAILNGKAPLVGLLAG